MKNKEPPFPETDEYIINKEKNFYIVKDNNTYNLICLKNFDSLVLKLKSISKSTKLYYEAKYDKENLLKISNIFSFCENIEDAYNLLIDNLNKSKKDLDLDFNNEDLVKLLFYIELPTRKKEYTHIDMFKKKLKSKNINEEDLNEINSKIESIKENQKEFKEIIEEKFERLELIISNQEYLENELKIKIKDIEDIKLFKNKYEKFIKDNNNKIEEIENAQKNILLELERIKNEKRDNNIDLNKHEINSVLRDFPILEENINKIIDAQDEYQNILNNNNEEINKLNKNILNCQNTLEKTNKEISIIKENQNKIQSEMKNKNKEIDLIQFKQNEEEKNKENDIMKKMMDEIDLLKKENETMKKKIISNDTRLNEINKWIKNKLEEIIDEKINPGDFTFKKTISSDLFTLNFYNNRACIFTCSQDDNIYVVYGVAISLDLECYDVLNDKKFIIIKKLHKDSFDSCRYFFDEHNNRDLLITASHDSHVKVVHFKKEKSEIITDLNFESIENAIINTSYLVYETIMVPFSREGKVKFYTMSSEYIGELEENAGFILGLSNYYWEEKKTHYALIANTKGIFAYIIEGFYLYNKFIPPKEEKKEEEEDKKEEDDNGFDEAYIIEKNGKLILIGPCFYYGYLYFWDFSKGDLIHKLETGFGISDICLWNNKYIFASLNNSTFYQFELINYDTQQIEKKFKKDEKDNHGSGIKILRHETKGNFLISFSLKGKLDLYIIEKNKTPF